MKSEFEKFSHPYSTDKSQIDLRSFSLKASDYINELAKEAGAEQDKFVRNALTMVRLFSRNHELIKRQIAIIEQRLWRRIEQRRRGNNDLPYEIFKNGVINTGKVIGSNIDAKLKIEYLSGNMVIYGNYGMGKTNLVLSIIPYLIAQGVHVVVFDVARDARDLLEVQGCDNGLVLNHDNDIFNVLEPIGSPEVHLQHIWETMPQDFNFRPETKEMLFNHSRELYDRFDVNNGGEPPSLNDLKNSLIEEKSKSSTKTADKNKIQTALSKLNYIIGSFKGMADCRRGYSLDQLDKFSFVSYEIGDLSEDKRSFFIKNKLRGYQHKGLISTERHKVKRIIVVDEAKNIFGKSRIGVSTNFIKDMYTKSRSIGCWWILSDQFPSELSNFTRAASCQVSFQHTVPSEIREIAVAMGCNEAQKKMIPQLGRYMAFQKIAEHPFPYKIMTHKSRVQRHIGDAELAGLMRGKIAGLNSQLPAKPEKKKVRIITKSRIVEANPRISELTITAPSIGTNPLEEIERFLIFIHSNPGTKLTDIYKGLNLSARKGGALKNKALDNGLVEEEVKQTSGRGRPVKELKLTDAGRRYIREK